jgi:hypothetical protein
MEMTQTEPAAPHPGASTAVALFDVGKSDDSIGRLSPPPSPLLLSFRPDAALAAPEAQPGTTIEPSPLASAVCGANGVDWRTYAQCLRRADPGPWAGILTRREASVAAGLLAGNADEKDVSRRFPIAACSFHRYVMRIFGKFGVHSLEGARRELRRRT